MFERFSTDARLAVVLAREEARTLHHDRIGVEHLLLGILQPTDAQFRTLLDAAGLSIVDARSVVEHRHRDDVLGEEDAEALKSIGIDLDAIRESLAAGFGRDALAKAGGSAKRGWFGRSSHNTGHIPFTREAKKALELSLREAVARKDNHIGSGHVMLGILRAPNDAAKAVVEPRIAIDELRRRVIELLDHAA